MNAAIDTAELNRSRELETFSGLVHALERTRGDQLDMLGMLRLAEIQVGAVRRALVLEARATGFSWLEVGTALGLTDTEALHLYGHHRVPAGK
ncbi:hypothetical protein [Brachybacterium sp. UNK5269]|uniref:hypothetical protein n=1 Tax=Brachybacterium sp. UNK5269 TaxID=3408576 RepID=UPI003BAEC1E7